MGEFFPFIGEGVFHFWRDLVEVHAGDEVVAFQEFQSVGEDGVANVLEVIFDQLEAVVSFLDAEQDVAKLPFADEVQ